MEFNKLVFAGLSVGCLAAAAGGSYLAVRQSQASPGAMVQTVLRCRGAARGHLGTCRTICTQCTGH